MKLKTLKDFIKGYEGFGSYPKDKHISVCIIRAFDELKQEAIKWMKHFDGCMKNTKSDTAWHSYRGSKHSLMNFFNITEEEIA